MMLQPGKRGQEELISVLKKVPAICENIKSQDPSSWPPLPSSTAMSASCSSSTHTPAATSSPPSSSQPQTTPPARSLSPTSPNSINNTPTTANQIQIDNIVINELLCYMQNQLDTAPVKDIIDTCIKFYDEDTIDKAKTRFYNYVNSKYGNNSQLKIVKRMGQNKKRSNIEDITKLFINLPLNDIPNFVAMNLSKIPPAPNSTTEIANICLDLHTIKAELGGIAKHMSQVVNISDNNRKAPAAPQKVEMECKPSTSGTGSSARQPIQPTSDPPSASSSPPPVPPSPPSCTPSPSITVPDTRPDSARPNVQAPTLSPDMSGWLVVDDDESSHADDDDEDDVDGDNRWVEILHKMKKKSPPPDPHWHRKSPPPQRPRAENAHLSSRPPRLRHLDNSVSKHSPPGRNQRTPPRHDYVIGTGHSETVKAMHSPRREQSRPKRATGVFITRLNPHTTSAQIATHIYHETGITARPEMLPQKHKEYCSYFIPCDQQKRHILLNDQLWPRNILVKPFYVRN